ncbi:hypothetical protein [Pseudomonas fitomaticsae]|uniref:Uncharacterized protein n=1 Tax=Pseudomonas fitomaticsae TaxID=2837969 RepID=A0ABY3PVE5_9PSED|nr:hypothetical protein [Pseudomonas fitomaticsae]UFP97633.1 hypothetical protein KJY40_16320 [Pseudomonas fitomaticsae]
MLRLSRKNSFLFILLAVFITTAFFYYSKEDRMSARVMMYYGDWSPEEARFDATRWFSSGMYRPRLMGTPSAQSPVTMLRNSPDPLKGISNDEFLTKVLVAMEERYPKVNTEELVLDTPDLRRQIRYAYSAFSQPDRPVDSYWLFVTIGGDTFVITIDWDVNDKRLLTGPVAEHLAQESEAGIAFRDVQRELERVSGSTR